MAKIRIKKLPPEPPVSRYKLRWVYSFFALTAPVWIPILFGNVPMSNEMARNVGHIGMVLMLILPLSPIWVWDKRRIRIYLIILFCALPFLAIGAFIFGWWATVVHFGP